MEAVQLHEGHDGAGCALIVNAAGGDKERGLLIQEQAGGRAFVIGQGLAVAAIWSIHSLRTAGMEKLYIGTPRTHSSAACSSAISSLEIASTSCWRGVRPVSGV